MKRTFLPLLLCLLAFAATAKPVDMVIFLTDDHSLLDSSVYGSKDCHTPHMERLAKDGLTFKNAYVVSPSCAPNRASLLTGLDPVRHGAEVNHAKPRPEIKKWPAYFHELGYEVVAFGKVSHYKHTIDFGFDHFAHDTFHDHAGIGAAAEFLAKRDPNSTRPLCLFVGSNWPHVPWPATAPGIDAKALTLPDGSVDTPVTREWRARYVAAVQNADKDLGTIYEATQKHLPKETIFLMSGDHGTQWPFGKWNLYDAGLRVPLLVTWPGNTKPGTRTEAWVNWTDFLPTLLEAAGGKVPTEIDGRSFLSVLRDPAADHRDRMFATHTADGRWNIYPMRSLSLPGWKYIRNLHPEYAFTSHIDLPGEGGKRSYFASWEEAAKTDPTAAAIVKRYHQRPAEELYDLNADPTEQKNLAADPAHQARLADMRKQVDEWMKKQGDKGFTPPNPRLLSDPTSYGPSVKNPK